MEAVIAAGASGLGAWLFTMLVNAKVWGYRLGQAERRLDAHQQRIESIEIDVTKQLNDLRVDVAEIKVLIKEMRRP